MLVNKTNGNIGNYALNGVRYLDFEDITNKVSHLDGQNNSNILIYPNPVNDKLQISFKSLNEVKMQVEIIDLHGNILQQQTLSNQIGTNNATISVSQLHKGFYLCRFQNGNKLETIKFIKK
jgi:hypothetical protein